jgi:hypothetical protein
MSETARRTAERFFRRNQLETGKKRPRQFIHTPMGRKMTTDKLLGSLANFLAGKLDVQPDKPPKFMRRLVRELDDARYLDLALAALAPLLDGIFRRWRHKDRKDTSWEGRLKLRIGDDLYERLYRDPLVARPLPSGQRIPVTTILRWNKDQRCKAGHWLLMQALQLDIFAYDDDEFPCLSGGALPYVEDLRECMIAAGAVFAPLLKPPPPWTGSTKTYDDGFKAKFVRDWRPESKRAIDVAFESDFEHATGVNRQAQVPLQINPAMLEVARQLAVRAMDNHGEDMRRDQVKVAVDVRDATWCVEHGPTFWNDYSCDRRGRIYALQNLNFAREDHVRSLFRFANGMKLSGDKPTYWLEIHCANCEGSTDKESRDERIKWVGKHRQDIEAIARDPIGTFDKGVLDGKGWISADKKFGFVAACRELAAAWADPENFVTHLPIGFDGSANGLQHLALLSRDMVAGWMTNIVPIGKDAPTDLYEILINKVIGLIAIDDSDHARWWRDQFDLLSRKQQRNLLKTPIMTFAYSVTPPGASDQIEEAYRGLRKNAWPDKGGFRYLADKVLEACAMELRGPRAVMDRICDVARHCRDQERFMEWTSPTGMPVENRYQKPNTITVSCKSGDIRMEHNIADGVTPEINRSKVLSSAAPNFVHSLDAAHLVKVVNAAASEGITDILTVHDCYSCLAPQATRFQDIILEQLDNLYATNNPLADLCSRNAAGVIEPPSQSPFPFHRIRDAKNAFG